MKTKNIKQIWEHFQNREPVIIAGPCSAETKEQVLETAIQLSKIPEVQVLRAGIWKPRTKPGNFEGVGKEALSWMQEAKEITGLPFAVEVANANHVEEALKHNADILWIGARTSVNPFSVQEIADSLRGFDIPVFIKNPINPDVDLWLGAFERMEKVGLTKLAAIHRGFSKFGESFYRNAPMWHIPIELRRLRPDLPIICDPSHICGRRNSIEEVSQYAANLDFNGLMIESHINPDKAWSDAKQQLKPGDLEQVIQKLIWRDNNGIQGLAELRDHINLIDDELLNLLSKRMEVAEKIGLYKKSNNMTILQTNRWNDILKATIAKAKQKNLSENFITKYLDAVHIESISRQNSIMSNELKTQD